jgi:hypothetical protein
MFEQDMDATQVARSSRVSTKSVYQWRRAWQAGGEAAWHRKGLAGVPASRTRTSWPGSVDTGPGRGADHPAVRGGLHTAGSVVPAAPSGFTLQVVAHRAAEQDEGATAAWRSQT